jgi:hypothetical protein
MKKTQLFIVITLLLYGCELLVIGTKKTKAIEISQRNPIGTIYLFKTELDSNNIHSAVQFLAMPSGKLFLAEERYELYDDMSRLQRIIGSKPITKIKADTISASNLKIDVEFDYTKSISFTTEKINDYWYITSYTE